MARRKISENFLYSTYIYSFTHRCALICWGEESFDHLIFSSGPTLLKQPIKNRKFIPGQPIFWGRPATPSFPRILFFVLGSTLFWLEQIFRNICFRQDSGCLAREMDTFPTTSRWVNNRIVWRLILKQIFADVWGSFQDKLDQTQSK